MTPYRVIVTISDLRGVAVDDALASILDTVDALTMTAGRAPRVTLTRGGAVVVEVGYLALNDAEALATGEAARRSVACPTDAVVVEVIRGERARLVTRLGVSA